jgi:signal transduction histidine kinase
MKMRNIFQSLSLKLTAVFMLTAFAYLFLLTIGVRQIILDDEVRETLDYYQSSYLENVFEDLQYPPTQARAEQLVSSMPFDMKIIGSDIDWSSHQEFPNLDVLSFESRNWDLIQIKTDIEIGQDTYIEGGEFARYMNRSFLKVPYGDYIVVLVNPKMSQAVHTTFLFETFLAISLLILLIAFLVVQKMISPIQTIQDGTTRIGSGELQHRITIKQKDELGILAKEINLLAKNVQDMLEAKQRLNLGVSHELRSPITRARLQIEMLEQSQHKEELLNEINAMETIISNLLDSEAINYGHKKLDLKTFHIESKIKALISKAPYLENIQTSISSDINNLEIEADEVLFEVMLKNVLENASRFTPSNRALIELTLEEINSQSIHITIRDFGPGFNKDDLEKVTEPFFRTSQSRSRESGGFGLGLYLSKQIVLAHAGFLKIKNHPDQGAVVSVELPLRQNSTS